MREKEIWKDIEGYEGYYMVSNMGNVKSLERTVWYNGGHYKKSERILKADKEGSGYYQVWLCKDGKRDRYKVHRLVAQAFIPNPNNLPFINHRDENKQNNCMENLEWCSRSYNNTYNGRAKKVGKKNSKPVYSISKESGLVTYWESAKEAERILGISSSHICSCCKGKLNSCGGFYWMYANTDDNAE